ncbi:MAG TPA: DUF177 domain-containing protein [Pyrinomonadaceae bacterium]|nr:DUF177 domain-containing protein [Pyrinomonadaceae bacterium]
MIIDIANVGTREKMIEAAFEPDEIDLDETVTFIEGVVLKGSVQLVDARATVTATIETDVSVNCARCLEPISKHLVVPFRAAFVDSDADQASSNTEIAGEQLEESVAEDGKVDLAEVIREQVLLEVPVQNFCKDDCKGLCQQCGANLNLIDCNCADDEIDPRWAALKNLR